MRAPLAKNVLAPVAATGALAIRQLSAGRRGYCSYFIRRMQAVVHSICSLDFVGVECPLNARLIC
jgi:hypothetical protein